MLEVNGKTWVIKMLDKVNIKKYDVQNLEDEQSRMKPVDVTNA